MDGSSLVAPLFSVPDPRLTDDLDGEVDLVLAHGILHCDDVDALVFLLCPLHSEDAAVLGGLYPDPAFGLTQQLAGEEELGEVPKSDPSSLCSLCHSQQPRDRRHRAVAQGPLGRRSLSVNCTHVSI